MPKPRRARFQLWPPMSLSPTPPSGCKYQFVGSRHHAAHLQWHVMPSPDSHKAMTATAFERALRSFKSVLPHRFHRTIYIEKFNSK
jgi:hypothetical protein